jgi:hypothetical protein
MAVKSFIVQAPGVSAIKHFSPAQPVTKKPNKLARLYVQAWPNIFQVKQRALPRVQHLKGTTLR